MRLLEGNDPTTLSTRRKPVGYVRALWDDDCQSVLWADFLVSAAESQSDVTAGTGPEPDWFRKPFPSPSLPTVDLQRQVRELAEWTGWSARKLEAVLQTTHTTVLALQRGRHPHPSRSGDLADRVDEAHAVVERIHRLAGTPERTARALEGRTAGAPSAVDELRARRPAPAYLAALDAVRRRETGELLVGDRPARGAATGALTD